jgi:hypothetical protein
LLRAARDNPAVTVASVVVLLGSAVASATIVVAADDDNTSLPPATTSVAPTTIAPTTTAPTTTAPPSTTSSTTTSTTTSTTSTIPAGQRCLVRLHGKGHDGADTYTDGNDVKVLTPDGNAEGWGSLQWLYFPNNRYNDARDVVTEAIDDEDCDAVLVNGFSNGAAFAAKLYCRGETFDGRLVAVVVDDPVPDAAVQGCDPDPDVAVTLYWTGALESTAQPGWDCEEEDWTCEGGETIGIDAYADAIGVPAEPSRFTIHQWYQDAPELADW